MTAKINKVWITEVGSPDVMRIIQDVLDDPRAGEVQIRQEAASVDFIDTQLRAGIMPVALPTSLGFTAAGIIDKIGPGVTNLREGDRVVYFYSVLGSYAEARNVPAERVLRLPDQSLSGAVAAGALFRGLTAWYLSTRLRTIKPGDFVLVYAAAGGVGRILIQWLKHLGAQVIGAVGSPEKLRLLEPYGLAHGLVDSDEDFVASVRDMTAGKGVSIVYESIGRKTFDKSLDCAARFGLIASFGWASGDVEPVSLARLRTQGSLFVTRPTVAQYAGDAEDFKRGASELFDLVGKGIIQVEVGGNYSLADVRQAHSDLTARRTTGSLVLSFA